MKRHYQKPEGNQKTFVEIDANTDQVIDVSEALAGPWFLTNMVNEFRRMDLDMDGRVDPREFDKQTYEWHSSLKAYIFPAFDRNGDGFLSLQEYRETPAANQALAWFGAHQDANGSGTLTFDEFAPPAAGSPPLKLAFLRLFVFHRFDLNSDQRLDPQEFPFSVNLAVLTAEAAFQYQDKDRSGGVSWEEHSKGQAANRLPALRQLFVVVDADGNQQLEFGEFCALPDFFKPADRVVPDPVRIERDHLLTALTAAIRASDSNQDGRWSQNEWPAADLLPVLKDPAATAHPAWDFDQDGNITAEELGLGVDLAFGLIDPAERKWQWHQPNGTVFIGYNWDAFDKNRDRTVTLEEFRASFWAKDQADNRFSEMDRDQDGKVSPAEIFATSWMLQNVVGEFLRFDTDHDGKVSHDELASGVEPWRKQQVAMTFPGFDTSGDGGLTFAEYRLAPVANPVINWSTPQADLNDDGLLDFSEFFPERKLSSPVWLCGLARVVFERLDRNLDQRLDPFEFTFSGKDSSMTAEGAFRLQDQDRSGAVNWAELSKGLPADRHPALRQLFVVFDADSNQQLEFAEFCALPDFVKPADRVVPDSLRNERDRFLTALKSTLRAADRNQDERWTQNEWPATALLPVLKDVPATRHHAWDLDKNGTVIAEELAVGADLAFGLIDPVQRKASWHTYTGTVFSGSNWGAFDKNRDLLVTREEFLATFWAKAEAPRRFGEIDRDQDGTISAAEMFATNWMYVNVISEFLRLDADRDGGVSSDELQKGVEDWRKKVAAISFPGFDASGDGSLSLAEFRLTPIGNPVINWGVAQIDQNGDGQLDLAEFFPERTPYGPLWLCGLTPLVFHHLDRDADGHLNSAEYDFQGKLAIQLAQPEWGPDPVLMRYERTLEEFRGWLAASDSNRDGQLSENEWPRSEIEQTFPVPDLHSFASWDVNLDGRVSLEEFQYVLREAWGITSRRCPEEWLRRGSGHIVDFIAFTTVDIDRNGQLSRTEFLEKFYGTPAERAKWYPETDRDADGVITLREMLASGRLLLMPRDLFQKFDSQRDGKLTPREIASNALSWQKASAALCFPAFDVDHDGFLSPDEFRWTPIANPLIPWTSKPTDTDHNGTLSMDEFYSPPAGESRNWLALLAHEYFSRWDRNHDGKLALDEYDFSLDVSKLDPLAAFPFADKNHDGGLSPEEVFLDARPDAKNAGAVIHYHRRKMRSEEAFLGADADRNRLLNLGEYQKYHGYMQGAAEPNRPAPAIPPARVTRTWDEFFTWGMLGGDLLLAVVGGVYWALRRRAAS